MELIRALTDKAVLGTPGHSSARPRLTARAILINPEGKVAVMYSGKYGLYTLPGGGVEPEETLIDALRREMMEETGCRCHRIRPLGYVSENRGYCDYTQVSCYYVVTTRDRLLAPHLTAVEEANKTTVQWYTLEEADRLIREPQHHNRQRKFLQARDVAALDQYHRQRNLRSAPHTRQR